MFKRWREYELKIAKRAWKETSLKSLGMGFIIGVLAYCGQMMAGLRTQHDTWLFIIIGFGSAMVGILCEFLFRMFLMPVTMATEKQEIHDIAVKNHRQENERVETSHAAAIITLQGEIQRLKKEIEDDSAKLNVSCELSLEHATTMHALITLKVLNRGKRVARIRRANIFLKPIPLFAPNGEPLMPDENLLNIPQKEAVVEIEGDDDIHEWKLELSKNPHFMPHEIDGEIVGKGYIELTSERKLGFEFLLLPDMTWNKLGYYGPPKCQ